MMDALGQAQLKYLCLEPPFQEILHLQTQHVIQLHARLVQHSYTHQSPEEGVSLEETSRVLLVQRQKFTSGCADLCERVLDSPYLPLVSQPILPDQLQLLVQTSLLKGTPRRLGGFSAHYPRHACFPNIIAMCSKKKSREFLITFDLTQNYYNVKYRGYNNSWIRAMPKVKRSRKRHPEGWELIEPTLDELEAKLREGKRGRNVHFQCALNGISPLICLHSGGRHSRGKAESGGSLAHIQVSNICY